MITIDVLFLTVSSIPGRPATESRLVFFIRPVYNQWKYEMRGELH